MTSSTLVRPDQTQNGKSYSWSPAELGWSAVSVAASTSRTGNWVNVAGFRRVGIILNSDRAFTVALLGGIGGVRSSSVFYRYNGLSTHYQLAASGVLVLVMEICMDEVALFFTNGDASNAANVTMSMVAYE